MNPRRWAIAGLAAVAALTLSTAGCSTAENGTGGSAASPTPAADPKTVLANSALELTKTSFKISGKSKDSTIQASIDPAAKHMTSTIVQSGEPGQQITVDIVVVAGDPYVKVQLGALAQVLGVGSIDNKWLHVDPAKIRDPKGFGISTSDPADAALLFGAVVTAKSAGEGRYTGTIDLTKAPKAGLSDDDTVTELADQAKAVPFEAAVDDKGRLISLKLNISASGKVTAQTWEATFTDFGATVAATKPAGAIETPANVYALFNQ